MAKTDKPLVVSFTVSAIGSGRSALENMGTAEDKLDKAVTEELDGIGAGVNLDSIRVSANTIAVMPNGTVHASCRITYRT